MFEKRVEAFDRDERLRESVEDLLCDMGKSSASYHIPSYMDSIEEYRMRNAWVYRLLQILLLVSVIAALVIPGRQRAALSGGSVRSEPCPVYAGQDEV